MKRKKQEINLATVLAFDAGLEEGKAQIAILKEQNQKYREALEKTLVQLKAHNDAPWACESVEGAEAYATAVQIVKETLGVKE